MLSNKNIIDLLNEYFIKTTSKLLFMDERF